MDVTEATPEYLENANILYNEIKRRLEPPEALNFLSGFAASLAMSVAPSERDDAVKEFIDMYKFNVKTLIEQEKKASNEET